MDMDLETLKVCVKIKLKRQFSEFSQKHFPRILLTITITTQRIRERKRDREARNASQSTGLATDGPIYLY